jgi:hypothetical protein
MFLAVDHLSAGFEVPRALCPFRTRRLVPDECRKFRFQSVDITFIAWTLQIALLQ